MFDFIRNHMKALQFVLVLLIFPSFVFFGIQGYSRFNEGDQGAVAQVDGKPISQAEFDRSLRERVDNARRQMPGLDPKLFETEQMKSLALDGLVRERVLYAAAGKLHLVSSDDRLKRLFREDPEFAQLRNPDGGVNRELLASIGMTSEGFTERLRQDLARRQVSGGLSQSALAPAAAASAALDALYQQREVQVQRFEAKDYAAKVAPSDAELEAYYKSPANARRFLAPEEAQVEYVVLDLESLRKTVEVPEEGLKKYYTENAARYTVPEERKVSQILIAADKDAPKAVREAAKAKATALAAQAKASPARFAELAQKNSDDDGTAKNGGQMEFFGRGSLLDLKPFEDAVFSLKPGEIAGPVETDFGYHVILLQETRGGEKKSYESVRSELETEVRNQLAQQRFAEAAVDFGNMVYEQPDSLKPVAERWKLEIRKADHVTRTPQAQAAGALASAPFLEALFASDTLTAKHNTKAIDIGANQLASGRVVQYTAAHAKPYAEVKAQVREQVVQAQAGALAKKSGNERYAALKAAPATVLSETAVVVSRAQTHELPPALLDAVLKAPTASLPAIVGVDLGEQGYAVAKITKLNGRDASVADPVKAKIQYAQIWGDAEEKAYYNALKSRFKVSISARAASSPADASGNELR